MTQKPDYLSLLYLAYQTGGESDCYGIVVAVSNYSHCLTQFYKAKAVALDPDLDCLEFRPSPNSAQELWIIRKGKKDLPALIGDQNE
jgi:hypothetical protein